MRNSLIKHGIAVIGIAALVFLAIASATTPLEPPSSREERLTQARESNNKGLAAAATGNYTMAIMWYTDAILKDPDYADAYYNRGLAYEKTGNMNRAISDYDAALRINPNHASAKYNLEQARQAQGGGQNTSPSTASTPATTSATAAYNRGNAAYNRRDYDQAIAEFTEAIRLDPNYTDAYISRGVAYHDKGDYDRAIADYEAALRINPNHANAKYFLGQAQQARSTGRGMRLGILAPEAQGLNADLAYLPAMVQGVLVSNFSKYSGISVLDRISLDRVITETLDPMYRENPDIVRLGQVTQRGHWLTGKITRTSTGYTLQLNITDTTAEAKTAAAYSGTCTVAQLDDHTAIQRAARELLVQLGIELPAAAVAELNTAGPKETITAQTVLAQGITAEKQGNNNAALDYYTQATTLDPALPEAATRFSGLADRVQGTKLAEKFDWLRAFAQTGGKYIFEITADENIPEQTLAFSGKNNITLTIRGRGANRTLNNGFTVASGVTLVLDNNITLRSSVSVNLGGTLIMNNGAAITGGGVRVSGTFTMNGGTISGNSGPNGGGVRVSSGGTFTMNGGEISGNSANNGCGVSLTNGTFTMNGGTISSNGGWGGYGSGGGVYMSSGTFTMSGGTISGNANKLGGGVYVEGGTFTMSGGTISGNTADFAGDGSGGGVYVKNATFTMSNGIISGNTARTSGGGVYVPDSETFTMRSGTISGNTASNGGGVSGSLTMSGGTISGNTASGSGGGVYGSLTMNGGTISGNTARENGGGVNAGGPFTMSNGTISGNTAGGFGGGVWVARNRTFTKTGGTITGYTGDTANGNAVKNSSGAVQNYKGHAVYAGDPSSLMKIKETTAGPGNNMAYDGSKSPPTASGAWDN